MFSISWNFDKNKTNKRGFVEMKIFVVVVVEN